MPAEEKKAERNFLLLMKRNLTRDERLKNLSDIKNLFASGRKVSVPGAKLVYSGNNLGYSRFMVTLIRKYGNSVQRNRAKRVAREVYRLNKERLKPGFDLAIILFPSADFYSARENQILGLLKKARLCSGMGE